MNKHSLVAEACAWIAKELLLKDKKTFIYDRK